MTWTDRKRGSLRAARRLFLTATLLPLVALPAAAQETALPQLSPLPSPSVEEGDVELDIARRHRSAFDPVGIALGGWTLLPSVASHLGYESNLYGAQIDRRSDGFAEIEPSLALQSNFSGASLAFHADGRFRRFFSQAPADENSYGTALDGEYDVSNAVRLSSGAAFRQLIENRDSSGFPDGLVEPIRFLQTTGYLRGQYEVGNLRWLASFDYARFDFQDAMTIGADGEEFRSDQKVRNQQTGRASLSADYSFTPDLGVFIQASGSLIRYARAQVSPGVPNLSANDYTALVGVALGSGHLIRGSVGVGYNWRTYRSGTLGQQGGVAFNADLKYFASPLMTISVTGSRSLEQAVLQNAVAGDLVVEKADGLIETAGTIRVDYELLRPLILNASVTVRTDDFRRDPRTDRSIEANVGALYHLNRRLALDAGASYVDRRVKGDPQAASYNDFTVTIGLQFSL